MSRSITKQVTIDAPPDVVWKALTEAHELSRWFPVEARVQPGVGGSIWLSWGPGAEGQAPITAWEPNRRLGWTEDRGPVKLAVDFHLEASGGGRTTVRLVQSGFGEGAAWDDEFHMTDAGWSYFTQHLRWYLERHRGLPRDLISLRQVVSLTRDEGFRNVVDAFSTDGALRRAKAGERYETTMANGEAISGTVVASSPMTGQLGFTIEELNDAILFIETEPAEAGCRPAVWLSTYGLGPRLDDARNLFSALYAQALAATVSRQS